MVEKDLSVFKWIYMHVSSLKSNTRTCMADGDLNKFIRRYMLFGASRGPRPSADGLEKVLYTKIMESYAQIHLQLSNLQYDEIPLKHCEIEEHTSELQSRNSI